MSMQNLNLSECVFYFKEDPNGVKFIVRFIPKRVQQQFLAESEKRGGKLTSFTSKFDSEKMAQKRVEYAVEGWENMKKKDLTDLLEVEDIENWKQEFASLKYDDEIPFTPENLQLLALYHSSEFANFLSQCQDDIKVLMKKKADDELKN